MWTIDCEYYDQEWESLDELLDDIISTGMDPNYDIMRNGKHTGETAWELIVP